MQNPLPSIPAHRLADPSYRRQLLNQVEALLSVLEVARSRVLGNLASPDPDEDRLRRVLGNLEGTLDVCRRARRILQLTPSNSKLPVPYQQQLPDLRMTFRDYLEVSSFAEYCHFRELGPVTRAELLEVDIIALCQRLGAA